MVSVEQFLRWKVLPRFMMLASTIMSWRCAEWFMDLPDPTMEQSGLISIVVGAGAAWFGLYAGTAKDKINGSGK